MGERSSSNSLSNWSPQNVRCVQALEIQQRIVYSLRLTCRRKEFIIVMYCVFQLACSSNEHLFIFFLLRTSLYSQQRKSTCNAKRFSARWMGSFLSFHMHCVLLFKREAAKGLGRSCWIGSLNLLNCTTETASTNLFDQLHSLKWHLSPLCVYFSWNYSKRRTVTVANSLRTEKLTLLGKNFSFREVMADNFA